MKTINEFKQLIEWTPLSKNIWSLKDKCGIYIIKNKINNKFYIGSSKYLYTRITEHRCRFRKLDGINPHIQRAYNKYGEENFEYSILEFCDPEIKYEREQYYLDILQPEYNTTLQVQANKGLPRSEHSKQMSSETQRKMVEEGKIKAKKAYIYNVDTYTLAQECNSIKDARKLLNVTTGSNLDKQLIKKKYIISFTKFDTVNSLMNFVLEFIKIPKNKKYIIVEDDLENITYYKNLSTFCKEFKLKETTIRHHINASKENPYKFNNFKLFFTEKYIPIQGFLEEIKYVPEFEEIKIKRGSI